MLFSIDGGPVTHEPYEREFRKWRSQISDADYQAMVDAINSYVGARTEPFCTSWMPGEAPAIDAAFPPLTAACGGNEDASGLFFGNIVWREMMRRPDRWYFKRAEKEGENWRGVTYWRRDD